MELLKVDTLEQAREKLMQAVGDGWQRVCEVPLPDALEKVLAEDVYGALDIPGFRRSMVDGYAVQSKDTPLYHNLLVKDSLHRCALTSQQYWSLTPPIRQSLPPYLDSSSPQPPPTKLTISNTSSGCNITD